MSEAFEHIAEGEAQLRRKTLTQCKSQLALPAKRQSQGFRSSFHQTSSGVAGLLGLPVQKSAKSKPGAASLRQSAPALAASRKENAKAAKRGDPSQKDADAKLTQRLQLVAENCSKISCEQCKAVLKFDEFMAHFDPLKVLNGETKCSKAPKRPHNTHSATSKRGASRQQRGELAGQTALARFSNAQPAGPALGATPATSTSQSRAHSMSKSRLLLAERKPDSGDNTVIVYDNEALEAGDPSGALAELQLLYDEVLAENGALKETIATLEQRGAEMQAEIRVLR